MTALRPSARRFQQILAERGYQNEVIEFQDTTRTAADAAAALGCDVAQIVKSLIFKTRKTGQPVLVLASGRNRVDTKKIQTKLGEKLGKADADFVREHTGFVIGGVPPLGHTSRMETFLDEDFLQFDTIWAAAGTPYAIFRLTPAELQEMTGGTVADVKNEA